MKYEKIAQKPYCCTAACLEMILKRNGINDYEQEDIAYDLGLIVPPDYVDRFKRVRTGQKPIAGYGTQIQKEKYSVNNFFKKNNIPLINEYHYITGIKEAKKFLKDNDKNDILVCLHCATLYDAPHANWGHMVLYDHMEDDYFVLQDPADNHDIEKIKLDKVLEAIKVHGVKKAGGFWLIKKTYMNEL